MTRTLRAAAGRLVRARPRRPGPVRLLLCGYYAVYVVWFLAGGSSGHVRAFLSDAAYLPLDAAGALLAVRAAWRAEHRRDRLVWGLVATALLLNGQGDLCWWWLEAVRGLDPFPSVADIGFSGFYVFVLAALLLVPVRAQSRRASLAGLLDVLALLGGGFVLVWYLALGGAVREGLGSLADGLDIGYPLADLLLVLAAGRVVMRGSEPRWTVPCRWLVAGAVSFTVADIEFTHLSSSSGFSGGEWLDLLWIGSLLSICLAASSPVSPGGTRPSSDRSAHLVPLTAIVASYAVVLQVAVRLPLYPEGGVLAAELLVTAVVAARQLVAVAETRALAASYLKVANCDALTGLASRRHFFDQAPLLLDRHGPDRCALVVLDVDHFKGINDTYGHQAGDRALEAVAAHLRQACREQDLLARLGGDEFVVLLVDVSPTEAAAVAGRLSQPSDLLSVRGEPVSLSIGWTSGPADVEALISQADAALYQVKAAGRCDVARYCTAAVPGPGS